MANSHPSKRLSYEESCRALLKRKLIDRIPPLPEGPPRHDDPVQGVRFFQAMIAGSKMEHLTLPRTFFGRSEIRDSSFRDSVLSESTANWNDFIHVNFSGADLSGADLRGCVFDRVRFIGASLVGADFRYCGFERCDFAGAAVTDAKFTQKAGAGLGFSTEQQSVIDWQDEDGDEPTG